MTSHDALDVIGRREELERLARVFERTRAGTGSFVLVAGEAGVGKTRLSEEALASSGLQVLAGRARDDVATPYGPVAACLRTALADLGGARSPLISHLAAILPDLGPSPAASDPGVLVEAVIGAFVDAVRRRPSVLFLDDLQWADNATLELLPLLADRTPRESLTVLGTYRSDEITRGHPLRRLRTDLRRSRRLEEITIGPLVHEDTGRLLERTLGSRPAATLVNVVFNKTQGVPLYVEEMAGALVSGGCLQSGGDGMELVPGRDVPLPESIRDAVMLRLDALSEAARNQLEIAAVAGIEFDLGMVAGLAGGEKGVEELLERNLITEGGMGAGQFRHALIREAIRDEIAWSRRRSLNRRIAAYLEREGAAAGIVAEHWLAAGEHEPARRALVQVAEHSCRLHAYRDAARAGQRALEIWPAGEDEPQRLDALEQLAHCAQVSGQLPDAVRALRELADSPLVERGARRRAQVLRSLATVLGLQGAWEQATEARLESARGFEALGAPGEAAVEWLAVAGRYTATSNLAQALDTVRKAGALADTSGDPGLVVRARGFEGNLLAMLGEGDRGRTLAQEALSLALSANLTEAAPEAYRRLASALDYCSDFAGSRDAYATALAYCRDRGDDETARTCMSCMSAIVFRTGDWKRALDTGREVLNDAQAPVGSTAVAHAIIGLVRACRGEVRSARRSLQESLSRARSGHLAIVEVLSAFGLGLVAEFEDEPESAAGHYRQTIEAWSATQDRHDAVPIFLWQSTFFARNGLEPETTRCADALAAMASGAGNPETMAALAHALAEMSLLAGNRGDAVRQFEQALGQLEKLDTPLELAVTTWRLGTALAAGGDAGGAVARLNAAYRLAHNLGARPLAARIGTELEGLGERPEEGRHPDPKRRAARGGLTRRQLEIVKLLAQGLTNKEIAARLFLSPRTVDMHVSHILDRLDARGRTEAARRAADLGLLD